MNWSIQQDNKTFELVDPAGQQDLLNALQDNKNAYGYTDLNTAKICEDIVAGVWDQGIDTFSAYMKSYPSLEFFVRPDYEVFAT